MEFAAAAITSIASTLSAGGAAAAGTAATAGVAGSIPTFGSIVGSIGGAIGVSGAASILSGVATVASVLAQQRAGEEKARALEFAAGDAEIEGQLEQVKGVERRRTLKAALVQAIGERDVATAASGVDLSFGTPAIARREAVTDTERAIATEDETVQFRRQRLLERAASYRQQAAEARSGALDRAAATALEGGARLVRRY